MVSPPCVCACALSCGAPRRDQREGVTVTVTCGCVSHAPPRSTHLSAAVVALVTLETLLVFVGLLVLDESIALVKDGVTVAAFLSHLDK